jgi:hypothetical protein
VAIDPSGVDVDIALRPLLDRLSGVVHSQITVSRMHR